MTVIDCKTEANVLVKLCSMIESYAKSAIEQRNVFRIGVSGGSLVPFLAEGLGSIDTEWPKWQIFFCDERYVPFDTEDSTFGAYKKYLIPKCNLKEDQFFKIDLSLNLENCAKSYETLIRDKFNCNSTDIPSFDLLLLGLGPDGHTCSLFPNHKLLDEKTMLIAPIDDSPKPPDCRITMTFPLINNARCCIFSVTGKGKADIIKKIFTDKAALPASMVKPQVSLHYLLDADALSLR